MSSPSDRIQFPFLSLLLVLPAVIVHLVPPLAEALQFDRGALASGQIYRAITCHWTHTSLDHLIWDALAFFVLAALCEGRSRLRLFACLVASVGLIPLMLWVFLPDMEIYRGLSGLDSALFVLLALDMLREKVLGREWVWVGGIAALLLGFLAKITFEMATGTTVFVDNQAAAMVPVPLAHIVGGAVGGVVGYFAALPTSVKMPSARMYHPRQKVRT